jgi:hypothetical protein
VQGLGFRGWGLGLEVHGSGFGGLQSKSLGFRFWGSLFRVHGSGYRV